MRATHALLPLLATLCLAACPSEPGPAPLTAPSDTGPAPRATTDDAKPPAPGFAPEPGARPRRPRPPEAAQLARSSNAFGLDLYAALRSQPGNLALSPTSLSIALTMAWSGARGETAAEMSRALHLTGSVDEVSRASGVLSAFLQDPAQPLTLRIANRLFGERHYAFQQAYLDRAQKAFDAPLEPLDFRASADASRQHINQWVAEQTEQRIKDLIPPGGVASDTRMVLVNAIYFLGEWATAFKAEATRPAAFHLSTSSSKDVPTMHQSARLRTATADGVQLVELPYRGGEIAMTIVLPSAVDGLGAVEQSLTAAKLEAWTNALRPAQIDLALPRFTIDPAESLALGSLLASLGMHRAFDAEQADFTAIADPPDPSLRLFISQVFHKAFVKVDEKGTEAAAATAIVMTEGSAEPPQALSVQVDHPFLFFIRDRDTGLVLFMGRVNDPGAGR
jgi:serpin B